MINILIKLGICNSFTRQKLINLGVIVDLKDYYRLLLKNLPLVLVATFLGIAVAAGITYAQTPIYQSNVQLFVSTPASALDISALAQGSSFTQQRVISYAQVINGPATLNPVIKQLKLPYTQQELARKISASAPLNTVLINLTVSDPDPNRASAIANAVGAQFGITVQTLESQTNASSIAVSIVKSAIPATTPSSPKKSLNLLLGLILGFGLGIGMGILRQIFDNTVKNQEHLGGLALLAAINYDVEAETKPLITDIGRYSLRTESFRTLRTNLQFIDTVRPLQIITFTSSVPGEGKTTSALNISIALAQAGHKTLFIEGDLRRPRSAKYLYIEKGNIGLTDILSGRIPAITQANIKKLVTKWGEHDLHFFPSGKIPPNPAELLNSPLLGKFFETLRGMYEFVIIDSPPLLPVTDAAILAEKSDGTVLVVKAGSTRVRQLQGSIDALTAVGAKAVGAIINMIPLDSRDAEDYGWRYGKPYGYRRGYRGYRGYGKKYGDDSYSSYGAKENIQIGRAPYSPRPKDLEQIEFDSIIAEISRKIDKKVTRKPVKKKTSPAKKKASPKKNVATRKPSVNRPR